ncbi:unnamed protein product, partial [marine sediment metagenome]
ASFVIPSHKRLVVTHVSGVTYGAGPFLTDLYIEFTAGGVQGRHVQPWDVVLAKGTYTDRQATFFADPDSTVTVFSTDFSGVASIPVVDIQGYYVNVP